jgi:phospholipid/cholesterol/gamma-HCH transport system permease protein
MAAGGSNPALAFLGRIGRAASVWVDDFAGVLRHISGIWHLFRLTIYFVLVGPFIGRSKLRKQLFPMMSNVGVRSLPIVIMVSFLIGAILVIQTGPPLKDFGQTSLIPKMVALSMCREFGPVMTAIILTARVGASFTAVLASMKINDEVMALETMAIHPVGYLVAPRFLAMLVMMPCLVVISYMVGMVGGGIVAYGLYDIGPQAYMQQTFDGIGMADVMAGLIKAVSFSVIISMVCCYYGFITEGGPMGLGRNTMVAVVTSLVVIILTDAILGAFFIQYLF